MHTLCKQTPDTGQLEIACILMLATQQIEFGEIKNFKLNSDIEVYMISAKYTVYLDILWDSIIHFF